MATEGKEQIPFVDLKAQYQSLKTEVLPAVTKVLDDCNFILGQQVKEFEQAFARYCGVDYAVGVANGTEAIHLALRALGIGPGDEVITVTNSFIATALAIHECGARSVLVDCEADSYNIDPVLVERAVTKKTKAIIPVHLYGQPANMQAIMDIAKRHKLFVIEDACQGHGAYYGGQRVGSFGDAACFSYYPGKNLGAYGDGGMVVSRNKGIADKLELLRGYGSVKKYEHKEKGYNCRLDTLQAAVLLTKLPHLDDWNTRRFNAAQSYTSRLTDIADVQSPKVVSNPQPAGRVPHVFHLYVVQVPKRQELIQAFTQENIQCGIHYPIPIHLQEAYRDLGYKKGDFPVAEAAADRILSLPMFPELTVEQINRVTGVIADVYGRKPAATRRAG